MNNVNNPKMLCCEASKNTQLNPENTAKPSQKTRCYFEGNKFFKKVIVTMPENRELTHKFNRSFS